MQQLNLFSCGDMNCPEWITYYINILGEIPGLYGWLISYTSGWEYVALQYNWVMNNPYYRKSSLLWGSEQTCQWSRGSCIINPPMFKFMSATNRGQYISHSIMQIHTLLKLFTSQKDYKNVIRLCREKIRKAKAQLELHLTTTVKDSKKCFYKYISNKRRVKENFHHLMNTGGNSRKD